MALALLKNQTEFEEVEKRVFPRFPVGSLILKTEDQQLWQVKDISYTGLQMAHHQACPYGHGETVKADLSWNGEHCAISGTVQWSSAHRAGIVFSDESQQKIRHFLKLEKIAKNLKSLAKDDFVQEMVQIPSHLAYWLATDGPVEVFVWRHPRGHGYSKFQCLILDTIVEWRDGLGLRTGKIVNKRDVETPLHSEDEIFFSFDQEVNSHRYQLAQSLIQAIPEQYQANREYEFLASKFS